MQPCFGSMFLAPLIDDVNCWFQKACWTPTGWLDADQSPLTARSTGSVGLLDCNPGCRSDTAGSDPSHFSGEVELTVPQPTRLAKTLVDMKNEQAAAEMPSMYDLCITMPLYAPFKVTQEFMLVLSGKDYQFDAYCTECEREAVFRTRRQNTFPSFGAWMMFDRHLSSELFCGRLGHSYIFYFNLEGGLLEKTGQAPSIASITGAELKKYKPLLRGGYFEELTKANGLISHGVGIGSFVYLRRIFEKLIQDHRTEAEVRDGPIDGFDGLRMDEKIQALKADLPPALVRNRSTYSILSSGIHALSEEECKLYYPVVKAAIIQILEQDFEARERKSKADDLEAEIAKIAHALKKS